MIVLPLDEYLMGGPSPNIVVDLHEEGGRVELTVELEEGEAVGSWRLPDLVSADAPTTDRLAYLAEVNGILGRQLQQAQSARSIDRRLLPDEARALSAALWHYAEEAERR